MDEIRTPDDLTTPADLAAALRQHPDAAAIWQHLSATHQRAHIKAIMRVTDKAARADLVDHTVAHLRDHHAH